MIIVTRFNLGITILSTGKYRDIVSSKLVIVQKTPSSGLIINVIKLKGQITKLIMGTKNKLLIIDKMLTSKLLLIVIGKLNKKAIKEILKHFIIQFPFMR